MRHVRRKQTPAPETESANASRAKREFAEQESKLSRHHDLPRALGNQTVARLLRPPAQLLTIQKKSLDVSQPTDADEIEADEVARKVVGGQAAKVHGTGRAVKRKGTGAAQTTPEFRSKLAGSKGNGQSLDGATRGEMEAKMGADFSGVKVHTGNDAHDMSESINARAFTHATDIYFRHGNYQPGSKRGKELLAHELAHTQQQREGNHINRSPGHKPGQDYSSGTITAKGQTILKTADKKANVAHDKHPVYFKQGDAVQEVSSSADKMWVEVKGAAHYHDGKAEQPLANAQGWVSRRSTSMTLGLFEGVDIKDETSTAAGGITSGKAIGDVTNIVLHQTGGSTAAGALAQYKHEATKGVGAQYLIGEDGKIHLVVPINERVGHVRGNRPVKVPEPQVADPKKVTDAEMKKTREAIDKFYNQLKTDTIISKDLRDYWLAMDSQTLYTTLKAHAWQLNPAASNPHAVGIEVVGQYKRLYKRETFSRSAKTKDYTTAEMGLVKGRIDKLVATKKITEAKKKEVLRDAEKKEILDSKDSKKYPDDKAKNTAVEKIDEEVYYKLKSDGWKIGSHTIYKTDETPDNYADLKKQNKVQDFLQRIKNLNLSPELKAQLLKTEKRLALEKELKDAKTSAARKLEIEKELDGMNKQVYDFMAQYDFMIYEDISGAQKYSLWLLVGKLVQHHKLNARRDVIGHEDVDKKVVGEGQNEAEFIRTMTAFTAKVKSLAQLALKANATVKAQLQQKWQYEFSIIESLDKGQTNNATVLDFFNHFNEKIEAFRKKGP